MTKDNQSMPTLKLMTCNYLTKVLFKAAIIKLLQDKLQILLKTNEKSYKNTNSYKKESNGNYINER